MHVEPYNKQDKSLLITVENITMESATWEFNYVNVDLKECNFSKMKMIFSSNQDYIKHKLNISATFLGNVNITDARCLISNCTFHGRITKEQPVLYIDNSIITVESTVFEEIDSIQSTAAIYASNRTNLILSYSTFWKNHGSAGIISVTDGSRLDMDNCNVTMNSQWHWQWRNGGIISVTQESHLHIHSTYFTENSAYSGGGIFCLGGSTVNISHSYFSGNNATYGGIAYIHGSSSLTMSHSIFSENLADQAGGIIDIYFNSTLNVDKCLFTNTTSGQFGGVIFSKGDHMLKISNSIFNRNSAGLEGGAIAIVEGKPTKAFIHNCTFEKNIVKAGKGGAIAIKADVTLTITDSRIIGNTAGYRGGGIDADFGSKIQLTNCNILNNSANVNGGGLYALTSKVICHNSLFKDNDAQRHGGGLLAFTRADITLHNTSFQNNIASTGSGGGLGVVEQVKVDMSECTFQRNCAKSSGGALIVYLHSQFKVDRSLFQENRAEFMGGVMFIDTNSSLWATHSKFINNSCNDLGGAIQIRGNGSGDFTECVFRDNWASREGGTFHLNNGNFSIGNCTLESYPPDSPLHEPVGILFFISGEINKVSSRMFTYKSVLTFNGSTLFTNDPQFSQKAVEKNFAWKQRSNMIEETFFASCTYQSWIVLWDDH